jgi:hypothetical protein
MVKCNADQVRRLQRALKGEKNLTMRQRIQIVLLRESEMTQPEIFIPVGIEAQIDFKKGFFKSCKESPVNRSKTGSSFADHVCR